MIRIVRSPAAEQDLLDIWCTVAVDNPRAADRLLDSIAERIFQLAQFPEFGPASTRHRSASARAGARQLPDPLSDRRRLRRNRARRTRRSRSPRAVVKSGRKASTPSAPTHACRGRRRRHRAQWNSAPVSTLIPSPRSCAEFGQMPSAITTPRRAASDSLTCSTTSPRWLPISTRSPSERPSAAASSGCTISSGRPSRFRDPGVSVKEEFRNERAGEVASRNGWSASAASISSTWSGNRGRRRIGPHQSHRFRRPVGRRRARPVRPEAELAVRVAETVR